MGRQPPIITFTVIAAMALLATAYPEYGHREVHHGVEHSPFVPVPHAEMDEHVQYLGKFAMERYDEQTRAHLKLVHVMEAEVLDRGAEHCTYHLLIKVHDGHGLKLYKCEVFQDLSGYEEPPLLNLGYFEPL
ncbi:unnamed protein product [Victoria cruziana]